METNSCCFGCYLLERQSNKGGFAQRLLLSTLHLIITEATSRPPPFYLTQVAIWTVRKRDMKSYPNICLQIQHQMTSKAFQWTSQVARAALRSSYDTQEMMPTFLARGDLVYFPIQRLIQTSSPNLRMKFASHTDVKLCGSILALQVTFEIRRNGWKNADIHAWGRVKIVCAKQRHSLFECGTLADPIGNWVSIGRHEPDHSNTSSKIQVVA